MTTFYVGQRVRIKYSKGWPELAGTEGTIVWAVDELHEPTGVHMEWAVAPDVWGGVLSPRPGRFGDGCFGASSDQLEPILYDGNKTVEWSECLWQPNRQGVPA